MKHYLGHIKNPCDLTEYSTYKFTLPEGAEIFIEQEGGSNEEIKHTYNSFDSVLSIQMPAFAVNPSMVYFGYKNKTT